MILFLIGLFDKFIQSRQKNADEFVKRYYQ
jgi:hypothetical protein